jgi:glutaconate CoA-transferase subunit B
MECSADEVMVAALAAAITNESVVYVGASVPLVMAAASLAKATHAPDATIFPFAGIEMRRSLMLTLRSMESAVLSCSLPHEIGEILNRTEGYGVFEPLAPAQIDREGNGNTLVIGPYDEPVIRLPGFAGADGIGSMPGSAIYYTTRHTPQVLVDRVDIRMTSGPRVREQRPQALGPGRLVTNLAIFDWEETGWRAASLHPGVSWQEVVTRTGFDLPEKGPSEITSAPSAEILDLLRRRIDPFNLRRLEFVGARERAAVIRDVMEAERRWLATWELPC